MLNCATTKDRCGQYIGIDDNKVELLKQVVDQTNAKIVLVSTWKEFWYRDLCLKDEQDNMATYLDKKLAKQGLRIIDKTNDYNSTNRGKAINNYLWKIKSMGVEVDNYIILDDELFDYMSAKLTKCLVRTNFDSGLTETHVRKAVAKLCSVQ